MKIQYDPALTEEVVTLMVQREEERGNLAPFHEYRTLADPIYDRFQPYAREREFAGLHRRLFHAWGFGDVLEKALAEDPRLERIEELFVGRASTEEEGADLGANLRRMGMKLRAKRFFDPESLLRYLRNELEHIADLLDPAFGYDEAGFIATSPSEANLIRDRYRVIWAISIDGRLQQEGKEPGASREERWEELTALCPTIPPPLRLAIFENLRGAGRLSHGEILPMAKDPALLFQRAGTVADGGRPLKKVLLPGSPCPLCRFPTYLWVEKFSELILELIKRDFPLWGHEEGACERCSEIYKSQQAITLRDRERAQVPERFA